MIYFSLVSLNQGCPRVLNSLSKIRVCLGVLAKLRKATLSLVMFVCPCTWNNSDHTGCIFVKCYTGGLLGCRESQTEISGTYVKYLTYVKILVTEFFWVEKRFR